MPRLEERDYTYFTTVRGMCRTCRAIVPARVFFLDDAVWQQSLCPSCENKPALICGDQAWYLEQVGQALPDRSPLPGSRPPQHGCPKDCGPCTWHASPCQLPVLSVTNACDLDCPICFTYNRPDKLYHMSVEEMRAAVDWVVEATGRVDLINITGGEPTLHPSIMDLLRCCKRPEIGRITMNTNGLRLAEDPALCRQLADLNVYVVLSFNTFAPEIARSLHGRDVIEAKLKAIDNLTQAGVRMTLLNVMMRDVNEQTMSGILDLMRSNDQILSATVQTMTYTGQGGGQWPVRDHLPVDEAARRVCEHSKGDLVPSDFTTRPSAHPLCYQVCYMLKSRDRLLPFARFIPPEKLRDLMRDSYLLRLESEEPFLREVIDTLYADGETAHLEAFRGLVKAVFPSSGPLDAFERQHRAEALVRTIYIHAHMDESTFDCSRAMHCPDLVPTEPGRMVSACSYNLFHRMRDERFYAGPRKDTQ